MTIKIQTGNCGVGDGFRSHLVALDERIHDALPHFPRRELAIGSRLLHDLLIWQRWGTGSGSGWFAQ
jgi:hypothetical protein